VNTVVSFINMEEEPADKDGGFRKIDLDGEGANESTADGHRRRRNLSISDGVKYDYEESTR